MTLFSRRSKKRENLTTCNFHNICIAHALFARKLNQVKIYNSKNFHTGYTVHYYFNVAIFADQFLSPQIIIITCTYLIVLTLFQVMREVGWVVFDEIHYMRDKGILYSMYNNKNIILMYMYVVNIWLTCACNYLFQNGVWSGRRLSYYYQTMFIMCSYLPLYLMPYSLQNGYVIYTNRFEQLVA